MKRYKRLYVVLAVLLAACIATFALSRYKAQKEQIQTSGETILSISADEVESLSWDYDGQTLSFHRDGAWSYDDDAAFPVDAEQMDLLLEPFAAFGAAFIIEDVDDLGQYGLDNPVCTIRITAGGESWTIQLGDYSKMDAQRYVSIGDGNVYLAAHDPLDEFDVTLDELIDRCRSCASPARRTTPSPIRRTAATPTGRTMCTSPSGTGSKSRWIPTGWRTISRPSSPCR